MYRPSWSNFCCLGCFSGQARSMKQWQCCLLLFYLYYDWLLIGWCQMRLSEEPTNPSRVLHLRGLPPDTTEAEITTLTTLFGVATNIILTRQKNQVISTPAATLQIVYHSLSSRGALRNALYKLIIIIIIIIRPVNNIGADHPDIRIDEFGEKI